MDRLTKALGGFKVKDDAGSVQAVFSTFNVVDHDGDVLDPGAFEDGQSVPMVWHHQWPEIVGKGKVSVQQDRAIFDGKFFLDVARGSEAYKTVKAMGDDMEWSYGFAVKPADVSLEEDAEHGQVLRIKRVELFEVSPVLVGASIGTHTLSLKGREVLTKDALTELAALADLTTLPDLRGKTERVADFESKVLSALTATVRYASAALTVKEGRVLSSSNMGRVHSARAALQELCESGACEDHSKSVGLDRLIRDAELELTGLSGD